MNILYTPHYSPKRFSNNIVNKIYHFIDKICVLNSDEVWNVSSRIHDVRKNMYKKVLYDMKEEGFFDNETTTLSLAN